MDSVSTSTRGSWNSNAWFSHLVSISRRLIRARSMRVAMASVGHTRPHRVTYETPEMWSFTMDFAYAWFPSGQAL
jgi:hypothetical protein